MGRGINVLFRWYVVRHELVRFGECGGTMSGAVFVAGTSVLIRLLPKRRKRTCRESHNLTALHNKI
jgi:hypothetical protein